MQTGVIQHRSQDAEVLAYGIGVESRQDVLAVLAVDVPAAAISTDAELCEDEAAEERVPWAVRSTTRSCLPWGKAAKEVSRLACAIIEVASMVNVGSSEKKRVPAGMVVVAKVARPFSVAERIVVG
jgi:hypothetical protein